MLLPVPLPTGWGLDTSGKIIAARLDVLLRVDLHDFCDEVPKGTPPAFFGRYVNLPGVSPAADIDAAELSLIAPRAPVVLFQHVRFDHWIASAAQGAEDITAACKTAAAAGYVPAAGCLGPHLIKDCEAVGNPGAACVAATGAFLAGAAAAGYGRGVYQGFDPGLSPDDFAALGCPVASSTPLNKPPTGRGFAYCQVKQVTIDGQRFDIAWARADLLGDVFVGVADVPVDVEPHQDPSGPNVDS